MSSNKSSKPSSKKVVPIDYDYDYDDNTVDIKITKKPVTKLDFKKIKRQQQERINEQLKGGIVKSRRRYKTKNKRQTRRKLRKAEHK